MSYRFTHSGSQELRSMIDSKGSAGLIDRDVFLSQMHPCLTCCVPLSICFPGILSLYYLRLHAWGHGRNNGRSSPRHRRGGGGEGQGY